MAAFKNKSARILTVILLAVLFIIGGWQAGPWLEQYRFYRFDPVTWTKARREDRYYMAKYLMDNQTLLGKTRTEIISMLGQPDADAGTLILYNLGPERDSMFRIDNDWLDIRFQFTAESKSLISGRIDKHAQAVATKVLIRPD